MNALYLYISIFFIFLFSFFFEKKPVFVGNTIPAGVLYSSNSSSSTIIGNNVSEKTIFKDDVDSELPVYDVYSNLPLPRKFIAHLSDKSGAAYILLTSSQFSEIRKHRPAVTQAKKASVSVADPLRVVKKDTEVVYNFNYFYGLVKGSLKNYFFSGCNKTIGDVTVNVYSLTPWNNKHIILFKITNNQSQFFFIANISIYQNDELTLGDFYNEPLVSPGNTQDFIAVIPKSINTNLILKIIESEGVKRVFNVSFTTPK